MSATSKQLDVLRLICDIQVASQHSDTINQCLRDIVDLTYESASNTHELRNTTTPLELIDFIKKSINRSLRNQGIIIGRTRINWLSVFFNRTAMSVHQRLSAVSPILTLYNAANADPLHIIRKCIPTSDRAGTKAENLFGSLGSVYFENFSDDLIREIVPFLDLRQFFLCSRINHSWLNVVFRSDVFRGILARFTTAASLRFMPVDEPPKAGDNRPHTFISWQIRPRLAEWDFFASEPNWFGRYVNLPSTTVTLQKRVDSKWISTDIVDHTAEGPINIREVLLADRVRDIYRLKIDIVAPFQWTLRSEPRALGHLRYSQTLLPQPLLWRRRFDQLHSAAADDGRLYSALSSISKSLLAKSLCHDVESHLLDPQNLRQIIYCMRHRDAKIRIKAAWLIYDLFKKDTVSIRGRDVLGVALSRLHKVLKDCRSRNRLYRGRDWYDKEQRADKELDVMLLCVGEFLRAAGDLNHEALQHLITIVPLIIQVLRRELEIITKSDERHAWTIRANVLWCLGTLSRVRNDAKTSRSIVRVLLDWQRRISTMNFDKEIKRAVMDRCASAQRMVMADSDELCIFDGSISGELIETELRWDSFLVIRSLQIIGASLRSFPHLAKPYIHHQLPAQLYRLLNAIKNTLIYPDVYAPPDGVSTRRCYICCIQILSTVTAYRDFFNLTNLLLDILCIYVNNLKKATADDLRIVIGYLWRSLTHNPLHFEKVLSKQKGFMKLLNKLYKEATSDDCPFGLPLARAVLNLHSVLNDGRSFRRAFISQNSVGDGDQECTCVCGSALDEVTVHDVGRCVCSMCFATLSGRAIFYRCNKAQSEHSPDCAYGLCFSCAKRQAFLHYASEDEQ